MKISYNWLKTYFDTEIPNDLQLAELLVFHSFEVEGLENFNISNDGAKDHILDIKVLPDRAHYALCHRGIAQEVSILTKQPIKRGRVPKGPEASLDTKPSITIEAPRFCRRYIGRYAEIPSVAPSNPHACILLEAIGQRAINAVVDATNMVMFDIGQPLHAFDADKVVGTIVIRAAKAGEKITLLDSSAGPGIEISLMPDDHVIADDLGPIALAGVKGGKRAGITADTRRLIIESANFDPTAVRRTATRLDLRSESSKRYENEITPELVPEGMDNVCALILHNIPKAAFGPVVDVYPKKAVKTVITFDPTYIEQRLGVKIPMDEAKDILERMDIEVRPVEVKPLRWQLTIPYSRLDLVIAEDIVEEVGRIYGYDHIKGVLPPKTGKPVLVLPIYYLSEKIRNILVDAGFSEVSLYTLVAKGEVETAKPLARDKSFARANLVDGMVACLEKNAVNADLLGLDAVKVFEIGHAFGKDGEKTMLALGTFQPKKIKGKYNDNRVIETIILLYNKLGLYIPLPAFDPKATLLVYEIDLNEVLKSYKLPSDASYSDLNFQPASTNRYSRISQYPFIVRDIAVFVPESIDADSVWQVISAGLKSSKASDLLARHSLFDTFKKDGKVSFAFRMVFQSMDKTLTDDEANAIMENIYAELKAKGWEVR